MFYFIVNKLCQLINAVLAYMGVMIDAGGSSCSVHQCCSLLGASNNAVACSCITCMGVSINTIKVTLFFRDANLEDILRV